MDDEIKDLRSIIRDTLWMARRYADGRQSYSVDMVNNSIDLAESLGIKINDDHTLIKSKSRASYGGNNG